MSEKTRSEDNLIEREVETETIKCDGCGSNMIFEPENQRLECPHCGSVKSFATDKMAEEMDLASGFDRATKWDDGTAVAFSCDNCGAKVVLSGGEMATFCPFCGTAHAMSKEDISGLKPNAVIPFTFKEDKAIELSKSWAKKRFFAPRKFKKNIRSENVKGVYTPCFTFDSYTTSYYEGRIGKTRTRTVGSGKNRRVETYIVWRNIRGTYYDNFDDLLVTAGSKFDQSNLSSIEPYQTNTSREYEENYLLGYMSYHYDREITDCWMEAKEEIDAKLRRRILSQYVYDTVAYLNVSTTHENVTYKYVMLPVYVGNYKYNKKIYNFYVNGNTGKVGGRTPKSLPKIIGAVVLGILAIVGLALLMQHSGCI